MTVDTSRSEDRRGSGSGAANIDGLTSAPSQQPAPGIYPVPGLEQSGDGAGRAAMARVSGTAQRLTTMLPDGDRLADAVGERFRLPSPDDPAPRPRWLVGICSWAAALGLGGLAVALRALVGLMTVGASWYGPTVVIIGLTGLLCTVATFASIHRRRLPWIMLGTATCALATDWIITGTVT